MNLRYFRNVRGFFSDYYLGSVFGEGAGRGRRRQVTDRETDLALLRFRRIRERAEGRAKDAASCREKFIRPLLRDVLGFHLGAGEDRLHGLFATAEAEERKEKPVLIVLCGAWDEDIDAGRGAAALGRKAEQAIARSGLRYGFLITGDRLRLVRAPGDGPRGAYLEADLAGLADDEDIESFGAFLRLFSLSTFLPGADGRAPIDFIERESREHAEKVSDDLKAAVFRAAESLIGGLIEDALARGQLSSPSDLGDADLRLFRDAALTCLYRILFILYAEARDPRLDGHPIYKESYSANGLVNEILENPEFSWPENRSSFWRRLRALFRIYDKGLPRISQWEHIPPRGSDFFSPETDGGKILEAARISDRLLARIILDLATSTPRPGVGRERVSFRELDIENLGAVYEGLLEFEPKIASETSLEIRVQGRTYCLSPGDVARLCEQKSLVLYGDFELAAGTLAQRFHPRCSSDEETDEEPTNELEEETSSGAADSEGESTEDDEESGEAVAKGGAARLVRRLEAGAFHFVPGPAKKGSGSFYTPRPLVRDLVRHTLGPLVKDKTAAEIERLRILDPACGSAHFLVEAMRFLSQALHRAYIEEGNGRPPRDFRSTTGQGWDAEWKAPDEVARAANSEARAWCKRRIAERCLFGVDLNPTAVELARVALWIESVAGDRPLTYFEHHVRCGNSLLGTWRDALGRPPIPSLERRNPQSGLFLKYVHGALAEAGRLRILIDATTPEDLRREGKEPESLQEQEYKDYLRRQASNILETLKLLFDLRSASAFIPKIWSEWDYLCDLVRSPEEFDKHVKSSKWWTKFEKVRARERFFHCELLFPVVFLDVTRPGFDVVLGNPPWEKILPNRHEFYGRYDVLIRAFKGGELDKRISELKKDTPYLEDKFNAYRDRINTTASILKTGGDFSFHDWEVGGKSTGGHQDAFKYFVERAWKLAAKDGRIGFVVPSAIYNNEGCTGLRHLLLEETRVERFYGFENRKKVFPIDSRYKFVSLVFSKTKPEGAVAFDAAFMRHDLEELEETALWREPGKPFAFPGPIPWLVRVSKEELEKLSPGTLAFLEYRNPRDREILLKMYEGRPLLGDQGPGTWNARFYTEFNMTTDRDLWTDAKTGKLWNPRQILGPVPGTTDRPPYYDRAAWPEIRARMAEKSFWPLYSGVNIDQFVINHEEINRWVNIEAAEQKKGYFPKSNNKFVYRRMARNTDERTCISGILPANSCFGDTLFGIDLEPANLQKLSILLNSFIFDFQIRMRIAGENMSFTYMERAAIPEKGKISFAINQKYSVQRVGIYEDNNIWPILWKINKIIGKAYGLNPDDFEYILSTFPVFARKRSNFYVYLQKRIAEWKAESLGSKPAAIEYPVVEGHEAYATAESNADYLKDNGGNKK